MKDLNEKYLEDYPKPIFLEETKTILNQMENCVCRIICNDGSKGTGFFCKIPISTKKYIKVFVTNNHVINKHYLDNENEIKIKIKDGKYIDSIKLKNALTYTNEGIDITFINLQEKDSEKYQFLDLDDDILNDEGDIYIGNSVYILQYPSNNEIDKVAVSYGKLKQKLKEKYNFIHYCCTETGSSGSPILNISNNKIIGIHKGSSKYRECNMGAFLYDSIKEFIQLYKNYKLNKNRKIQEIIDFMDLRIFGYKYNEDYKQLQNKSIHSIFNQGLISDINSIKYKNEIIAYKLFLKDHTSTPKGWIPAWHGTKIENLESIIKYGLKQQGTKLPDGQNIPKTKYTPLKETVLGIKNWEKAIFATPCFSCASVYSFHEIHWYYGFPHSSTIIEIRIRPGSFTKHQSEEMIGYIPGHGYATIYHNDTYYRIPSENDIAIKSITFVSRSFLQEMVEPEKRKMNEHITIKPNKIMKDLNNLFSK